MHVTSTRLRALNAVIDEGSFKMAAARLGLSQPAIRQSISDLEKAYNVSLFKKRGQFLVPTDLALKLSPLIEQISQLEKDVHTILEAENNALGDVLTVGLGNSRPGFDLLEQFQKSLPNVRLIAEMGNYAQVLEAVLNQTVDVGVLPNIPIDDRFERKPLLAQGVVAIINPNHPLAGKAFVTLAELSREKLIFRSEGSVTQRVVNSVFLAKGPLPKPAMVIDTRDAVCEAVAQGLGIGFIWRNSTLRADGFIRIRVQEMNKDYYEYLFRRKDHKSPLVDMLFDMVPDIS